MRIDLSRSSFKAQLPEELHAEYSDEAHRSFSHLCSDQKMTCPQVRISLIIIGFPEIDSIEKPSWLAQIDNYSYR